MEHLIYEKDGPIARVVLNRPRYLNAQNYKAARELDDVARIISKDSDIRIVAISGSGRAFCTGIDLQELSEGKTDPNYYYLWEKILRRFETMEPLVLCLMHGYCLGGGLQLALACDIRVSTPNTEIGLPATRESLIPGLATWRLERYVGLGRAKRMIISGKNITGLEAQRIGLVDHIVDEQTDVCEKFEEYINEYLRSCSKGTRMSKIAMNILWGLGWDTALPQYLELQDRALTSKDFTEAKRAYKENRDPIWE